MKTHFTWIRSLILGFFGLLLSLTLGLSADSQPKRLPGRIVVAKVVGSVSATNLADRSARDLKENDVITEKYTVNVGAASSTILIFSNGSAVNLQENSSLVISEFLQDPFSTPYAMTTATEEPTTSVTNLNLQKGEVVCNVKKLHTKGPGGSTFQVKTPVGAAGVRGTTFSVRYVPAADGTGRGTYTLSVTEGEVALTDTAGTVTVVTSGREVAISVTLAVDPVTGETTVAEIVSIEVMDIPVERQNAINQAAAEVAQVSETVTVAATPVTVADAINSVPDAPPILVDPEPTTTVDP